MTRSEQSLVSSGEPGTVWLVGAGPGDAGLITVAGLAALRQAQVVVYDRLAAPALLDEAPPEALRIDAGKASGAHTLGQDAINKTLAAYALSGKRVVRLKGGDPFLFGRGGEEALYLRERAIPFRVVPGVSSALAAPAYAGIPVTQRGMAGSLLIATGHEAADGDENPFDWQAMARAADTLVFLMGVERLAAISERLIAAGRPAEQLAALVRWGSTPRQTVLTSTLGAIAEDARRAGIQPPAALVIGEVVALRERLAWFETLPLFGARVLVTRSREQASTLSERLRALGAEVAEFPSIRIAPLEDYGELDAALADVSRHDWAVFASQNGVEAATARLDALARDARAFAGVRICAIGPATARALAAHGLRADLTPPVANTDGVIAALMEAGLKRARVLLLRPDIAPPALAEGLRAAGAEVRSVVAYRTTSGDGSPALAKILTGGIDILSFTSSSTVANLLAALDGDRQALANASTVSIGPMTSASLRAAGLPVDREGSPHTIDGLVGAIEATWAARRSSEGAMR